MEPPINKTIAKVNKSVADINKKAGSSLPSLSTLNAQTLADNVPFATQPVKPSTQMVGLGGTIEAQNANYTQDLQTKAQSKEKVKDATLDTYLKGLLQSEGEVQLTDEAYKETVDPLEAELKDINQQIFGEQHALRRRLEALAKNPQGLETGALNDEMKRVENESISKQADLSVIQLSRQGKYDSAKAIADRAVQAKLEQQRNINEALRINYEENRDLFTAAEQRAFEAAQSDRERALDMEAANLKEISDLSLNALQNGAPAAIATAMRQAKTAGDAIRIGGQYIDALDRQSKQAQIANTYDQITARALDREERAQDAVVKKITENATKQEETTAKTEKALGILQLTQSLKQHPGFGLAVGPNPLSRMGLSFGIANQFTGAKNDFIAEAERLANMLTLDNMKLLKGPASDRDVAIIAASASKLNTRNVSESAYAAEITRIEEAAQRIVNQLGITPEQASSYFDVQQDDLSEIDSIYGVSTPSFSPANYF